MKSSLFNIKILGFFRKHSKQHEYTHTTFEFVWTLIVLTFAVALLLLLAWNVYLFIKVQKNEAFMGSSKEKEVVTTINRNELTRVLETFEEYAREAPAVLDTGTGIVDPSL